LNGNVPNSSLLQAAIAVQAWLRELNRESALIGGFAVSLLGVARTTLDVDVLIYEETELPPDFLRSNQQNIAGRISDPVEFSRRNRVLLIRHLPTKIDLDVSLGMLPFEAEVIDRAVSMRIAETEIRVATVEDIIIMKAIAGRAIDWADIESLLQLNPELDKARIRNWSEALFELTDNHDAARKLQKLLA
jgi:hypothetical protein